MNIVNLRESPSLNDIPGQLRQLADNIEAGKYGEVYSLFAVMPRPKDFPTTFGWGNVIGTCDPIVQFELAKHHHVTMILERDI